MKKELKDFLPFYLGCEVLLVNDISEDYGDDTYEAPEVGSIGKVALINDGSFQINCGSESEDYCYGVAFKECYIALWDMKAFKLLLRPLSDMTEKEAIECGNLDYDFSGEPDLNKWTWKDFDTLNSPKQFLYLLSKHFDLFGLIEAGLAIDKSTLK